METRRLENWRYVTPTFQSASKSMGSPKPRQRFGVRLPSAAVGIAQCATQSARGLAWSITWRYIVEPPVGKPAFRNADFPVGASEDSEDAPVGKPAPRNADFPVGELEPSKSKQPAANRGLSFPMSTLTNTAQPSQRLKGPGGEHGGGSSIPSHHVSPPGWPPRSAEVSWFVLISWIYQSVE